MHSVRLKQSMSTMFNRIQSFKWSLHQLFNNWMFSMFKPKLLQSMYFSFCNKQ